MGMWYQEAHDRPQSRDDIQKLLNHLLAYTLMNQEDEKEIVALVRAARKNARGYADYFGWAIDRDFEEVGIIQSLAESLDTKGQLFFSSILGRGRGNDPPDCEAETVNGERIAIEVTELVDGEAIKAFKNGSIYDWAVWTQESFIEGLERAIESKDSRFTKLKGTPYPGGYFLVIHTDEPTLNYTIVERYLNYKFKKPKYISRAFLVLGYDPSTKSCPFFELELNG